MKASMLACGVVTAVSNHSAMAEVFHFVHPGPGQSGHYAWGSDPDMGARSWLDITRPSSLQPDAQSGNSVGQVYERVLDAALVWHMPVSATPIASLLRSSESGLSAQPLPAGAGIGLSAWWHTTALHVEIVHLPIFEVNSLFPEGERRYIGVRMDDDRYGWIEVELTGTHLAAFAWAYETTPGVPILAGQVPAPSAAVVLALASLTTIRRRRP